jgi:hypothetical protein
MADQNKKPVVDGKVQKDKNSNKKFKIQKGDQPHELDMDIEIEADGSYEVDKLSAEGLPSKMSDGTLIRWSNNFSIKENGSYIKKKYKVTIPGLSADLAKNKSRLVIYYGSGNPAYYEGTIVNDTFELMDGDPAAGAGP